MTSFAKKEGDTPNAAEVQAAVVAGREILVSKTIPKDLADAAGRGGRGGAAGGANAAGGTVLADGAGSLPTLLLAPHEPSEKVTALELPYRLVLSPIAPARWHHAEQPVSHRGRTELWHTRLSTLRHFRFGYVFPHYLRKNVPAPHGPPSPVTPAPAAAPDRAPTAPAASPAPRFSTAPTRTVYWSACSDNPCKRSTERRVANS